MKSIRNSLGTLILIAVFAFQSMAVGYEIDKSKSTIKWNGKKVTGEHYGTIGISNGHLQVENNNLKSGVVEMDMNSIVVEDLKNESSNKKLTGHLKSDDFFSVENHPKARLEIKNAVKKAGNNYTVTGDLTIKNITHPVTFDAVMNTGNEKLTAKGKVEVDRTLYDIKFRSGKFFSDLGDNLIYDTFTLEFDVVANEAKATSEL
ncbi:MAG TPA: YceI family protein [Mariniphaga sp.]|nr:YceI family protein [Mariniphaga sp.]